MEPKLLSASVSLSNVGIESSKRIARNTSRTRALGRDNFKLPPPRMRETYVPTIAAIPELSIMVTCARFIKIFGVPSATNFRSA